jgi:hypothetical protein
MRVLTSAQMKTILEQLGGRRLKERFALPDLEPCVRKNGGSGGRLAGLHASSEFTCYPHFPFFESVGDSPEGPLKQLGKSRLEPAKTKAKRIPLKRTHEARPTLTVAPAAHQGGPLKGPLDQAPPPSSGLRPARGCTPTSSGLRLARGCSARARPFPHAGTCI